MGWISTTDPAGDDGYGCFQRLHQLPQQGAAIIPEQGRDLPTQWQGERGALTLEPFDRRISITASSTDAGI